ncbi:MAG: MBL fold metallo-hydrolase [Oscillospiraceae bacterium]|nr:MBL fold metallo-hydrolase [Oscillospiraceae bacterium]
MKVTYLGQAGLMFCTGGKTIMIDPYLSDSVGDIDPKKHRRVPVEEGLFDIRPDIMIFTHNHLDHFDPQTVGRFITSETNVTVLAAQSVWGEVRKAGGENNYVLFDRHTSWTEGNIRFTAVKAAHSDVSAIGVIIDDGEKKYYVTGDTLYNDEIFGDLPEDIYAVFLPVNGVGNNMNMQDAARFAARVGAEKVVPLHIGLFDDLSPEDFVCEGKVPAKIYEEIPV